MEKENNLNQLSPLEQKQKIWGEKLKDMDRIVDGLGMQMDENIKECVVGLWLNGFNTSSSCGGHIENIEDVTSQTNGVFGTLFSYGMVYVQTAGTHERFEFDNVPNPGAVERMILDIYESIPPEQRKHQD
jgi:hypothetical protein